MTTIAVDSHVGVMAADRRQVSNDVEVIMECNKISKIDLEDGIHLVGCSGHESPAAIFLDWYEYGDEYETPDPIDLDIEEEDFEAVILAPDGTILVADRFMSPYEIKNRFYCSGTGGPFAWAVLKAGCGIKKAIETAISMDPYSGGGYDIIYLQDINS